MMRQFDAALKGIEISVNTLVAFYQKGADESLKTLRESIGDELCGWLMPGWSYWRAAQGAVQALGEYVMAYAFNTSLEEKIKSICPVDPKVDPKSFAQWLLGLKDISSFVNREWDEQLAYDGWYAKYDGDEKTTEEGGAAMKAAIIDALEKMRAGLVKQRQDIEKAQSGIADKAKAYDDQAKAVEEKFRSAVAASMEKAKPYLDKIEAFRQERMRLLKDDASDMASLEEAQFAAANKSCYTAVNRQGVLDAFDVLVGPWREGKMTLKDLKGLPLAYDPYRQAYWRALNEAWSKNKAKMRGVANGCDEFTLSKAYWVDAAGLDAAANILFYEACEKLAVINTKILEEMASLIEEADRAETVFQQEITDFIYRDIPGSLAYPDGFRNQQYFDAALEGASDIQKEFVGSGLIMKQYEALQAMKDGLSGEASATAGLVARQKAIYDRREQVMMAVENRFNNVVSEALRGHRSDGYLRVQRIGLQGPQYFFNTARFANAQGADLASFSGPDERSAQAGTVVVVDAPDKIYRAPNGFPM